VQPPSFITCRRAPQPNRNRRHGQCKTGLRRIRGFDRASSHTHQALNGPAGIPRLQHDSARKGGGIRKGKSDSKPNRRTVASQAEATVLLLNHLGPATGGDEHQRDQQAELRFVGEKPDENSCYDRPLIEKKQTSAQERGRQKAVLTKGRRAA
jgi:hypothetical protein